MSRPSRFGCLGCVWVVALAFGTVVQLAALWWISPQWLQRLLPGVARIETSPELILVPGDPDELAVPTEQPSGPVLWEEYSVSGSYDPQAGLRLDGEDGSRVEIPPGALAGAGEIRLTPLFSAPRTMYQPGLAPVGPMHDLRVGGNEHQEFLRPIRLSLPFDRGALPAEYRDAVVKLATWERGGWRLLDSIVDAKEHRITAETSRACIVSTIVVTTAVGIVVRFSEPGNAFVTWILKNTTHSYETAHFVLHYDKAGDRRVPEDGEYPLAAGRKGGAAPLFVQDMGRFMEEAYSQVNSVGFNLKPPKLMRWDVYLLPLKEGVLGLSAMGGPVMLDNDFRFGTSFAPHYEWLLRKTCAHELVHVAQNQYYSQAQAMTYTWWVEATAEYLALKMLAQLGHSDPYPHQYMKDRPKLLRRSFLLIAEDDKTSMYAYARFFSWLEAQGIDMVQLIRLVSNQTVPSPQNFDRVLRHLGSRRGLGELLADFAIALHHDSLWSGEYFPADVLNRMLGSRDEPMAMLSYRKHRTAPVEVLTYAEDSFMVPAVTARHYLMRAVQLPEERQAKLVLELSGTQMTPEQTMLFGPVAGRGRVPYTGSPTPLSVLGRGNQAVVYEVVAAPANGAGQFNLGNLILVNRSLQDNGHPIQLRRWLLMAPTYVAWGRAHDGQYTVTWQEAELKLQADEKAFAGYNVYRRRWSDAKFPARPVNSQPVRGEVYLDRPPADQSWAYTVTVVDTLGNESAPAPIDLEGDPFVGTWTGRMRLTRGSVAQTVEKTVRFEMANTPGGVEAPVSPEPLLKMMRGVLTGLDLMLRIGIPVTYEVKLVNGRHVITPLEALGQPIEEGEPLIMSRVGMRSLAVVVDGRVHFDRRLSLDQNGEVHQEYIGVENDPDIGPIEFGMKLDFTRQTATSQPAAAAP